MDAPSVKDTGIQLLKKGRRGLFRLIFSRIGLITLLLILNFSLLFFAFFWFEELLPSIWGGSVIFSLVIVLYLLNSRIDPTAKITWLVVIMLMPVFGSLLFLYTQTDVGHRTLKKRLEHLSANAGTQSPQQEDVLARLDETDHGAASLARYLYGNSFSPIYENTSVTYFPLGEDMFASLLSELEQARNFIFLEYFIVDEGLMWGKVLEILSRKAREGVEVRVMYDGTCEFSTLPHDYPQRLKQLGIRCKAFAPVSVFVSTHYNYRDHRKILIIDGHTAFNGGINLADEYINRIDRFGHWKDTAVMLKGDAVRSFTQMFLQMWSITEKSQPDFSRFLSAPPFVRAQGFVIPYGDSPLDNHKVGERVYMDLLNRAHRYVYIMTPYLILDGAMETALRFAAERGVDVRLILPGIPDKIAPYALAKTHYRALLDAGVKIFEYTPGFVHAKVFIADDREAVVGTINLDYRSLYHHFECATYMHSVPCIEEIRADFEDTRTKCRKVTYDTIKKEKWTLKLLGMAEKVIAPLL